MSVKSIWLRRIHKWVGLVIGLQVVLWAVSGAGMALLDMAEVAGGPRAEPAAAAPPSDSGWMSVQRALAGKAVGGVRLVEVAGRKTWLVASGPGERLFDAASGAPLTVDSALAANIAGAAHPGGLRPERVVPLSEVTLAVRDHALPIWRADFADPGRSTYYVSGVTGELLERRNQSWQLWDIFWMLHTMDYAKRTSFNHPLIVVVGFATVWLAVTGFWLLFRTMWRHDFAWTRRRRGTH